MNNWKQQVSPAVATLISDFTGRIEEIMPTDFLAAAIFGSAAEGRMRAFSDVNVIYLFKSYNWDGLDGLRELYRQGHAAVELNAMFLLQDEMTSVAHAFPMKYLDIKTRHLMVCGDDFLKDLKIPRTRLIEHVEQTLLNVKIRGVNKYLLMSLRAEQFQIQIAELVSSLRAAAHALLFLQGKQLESPRKSLETITQQIGNPRSTDLIKEFSNIREQKAEAHLSARELIESFLLLISQLQGVCNRISASEPGA